jgi:phosphodiesterase/alkaline phosphatase D-like protein
VLWVGLVGALALLFSFGSSAASAATYVPGTPATFCTGTGAAAGQCEELKGVAVDQSNGNIYVIDANAVAAAGNYRISQYSPAGTFLRSFGVAVADGTTLAPQVCTATCFPGKASTGAGGAAGAVGTGARGIAVDPTTHIVYFVAGTAKIAYYDGTTGSFLGEFIAAGSPATGQVVASPAAPQAFSAASGLGIDSSTSQHYLYVATGNGTNPFVIDKFKVPVPSTSTPPAYVCQISGKEVAEATECHGTASKDGAFNGLAFTTTTGMKGANLAVDGSGNVFVAEEASRNTVSMFDSTGAWVKAFTATVPVSVAAGPADRIFVGDSGTAEGAGKIKEFQVSSGGVLSEITLPASGSLGVAVDTSGLGSNGTVYVSDKPDKQLRSFVTSTVAPTVTTTAGATNIRPTAGDVAGSVNPNGSQITAASCKVEYGLTTSYGSTAPCSPADPGAGSSAVPVTASLSSLTPNTLYHFRFTATNAGGVGNGSDQTFTTAELLAPTVVTQAAAPVGKTTTTLNGTVNPNFEAVSDCHFEYGLTTSYGQTAPCSPAAPGGSGNSATAVSAAISSLTPATEYHFRLVATNPGGTTNGSDLSFTTTADNKPIVTTTAGGTSITQSAATVDGTVNPNGLAVSSCKVKYGLTVSYTSEVDCESLPAGTGTSPLPVTGSISGLTANTTYHFAVFATNADGTSQGADREFKTLPNAPTVINTPEGTVTQTSAVLNGDVNANGADTTACNFQVALASDPTFTSPVKTVACSPATVLGSGGNTAVTQTATGLTANTSYIYRVVATNTGGTTNGTPAEPFSTSANAPTVINTPEGTVTQTTAVLNGDVNANGVNATCSFQVALASDPTFTSPVKAVACTLNPVPGGGGNTAVTQTATGLTANTSYIYRTVATNTGGTTNATPAEPFSTLANAPTVTTPVASEITQTGMKLTATVNPNSSNVTGCSFEYGTTTSYGQSVPCSPANPGPGSSPVSVSASISSLSAKTTYHFRLKATNGGGTSNSADGSAATLPNAPTVTTTAGGTEISQTAAKVAGTVNPNGGNVSSCKVEYGASTAYGSEAPCASLPGSGSSAAAVSTALSGLAASTTYHFRFVATNAGGTGTGGDQTFTTASPPPPPPPATCPADPSKCPSNVIKIGSAKQKGLDITLKVTVPGPGALSATGKKMKPAKATAKAAGTTSLKLKLTSAGKTQLKKKGKLKVKVKIVFTPTGGLPGTTTKAVTFKLKK